MSEDLDRRFNYHAPDTERVQLHEQAREQLKLVAHFVESRVPDGREKSLALTKLEEAMFWTNAAIARQ